MKNYSFIDDRRQDGYAGAAICLKNNISYKRIDLPTFSVINAVAIETTNLPVNLKVLPVYVPAKKKSISDSEVRKDLLVLTSKFEGENNQIF